MGIMIQLFTLEQLKALDPGDLQILRDAIQRELRTSPAVKEAIRANVEAVYNALKAAKSGGTGH